MRDIMRTNSNKLAYPSPHHVHESGLTKLELISAMAMKGILCNPNFIPFTGQNKPISIQQPSEEVADFYAKHAVNFAKALLTELEKENK